jgi:hypothetical protein
MPTTLPNKCFIFPGRLRGIKALWTLDEIDLNHACATIPCLRAKQVLIRCSLNHFVLRLECVQRPVRELSPALALHLWVLHCEVKDNRATTHQ